MTKLSYAAMVAILAKPGTAILETLTPQKAELWHHASCIPGEAAELFEAIRNSDVENGKEECGDLEFYMEGARTAAGITREQTLPDGEFTDSDTSDFDAGQLCIRAGNIFDAVKKIVIYNKPFDDAARVKLIEAFTAFEKSMTHVRSLLVFTRAETLEHNYDKLMNKRYPNGYTDEAAQARADKA